MKITKFGHCCMLIEEGGLRFLTDPGTFSTQQNDLKNIDVILITHEHADHFHIDSVKQILKNNPDAKIITNAEVGKLLDKENLPFILVQGSQMYDCQGVSIEGVGNDHAEIYESLPPIHNTGYFIGNRFYYPGDSFAKPDRKVEVLALPVAGPWMKISEAIDFAKDLNPDVCFPVHDAVCYSLDFAHKWPNTLLKTFGIKFVPIVNGQETEF